MSSRFSQDRLLHRLGGRYLLLLIAAAQILALLGALPGMLSISANIDLDVQQAHTLSVLVPPLILVAMLVLLGVAWSITKNARKKLNLLTGHPGDLASGEELLAWREITSLGWRYGLAAGLVMYVVVILPVFLTSLQKGEAASSVFQPAALNTADPMYILLGGFVSLIGSVLLAVLLIERFTLPIRPMLLPKDFESQLQGRAGLLLDRKLLVLSVAVTALAVSMIAPIGYNHTVQVLYTEVSSLTVFRSLQLQLLIFSVLALLSGAAFSFLISRSISGPINDLIKTFNRIEQGDLTQRAPVGATDELGIVMMQFNRMVSRLDALQETLEQQVVERTRQLAATNEVGRVAASSLDPEQLIARVTPLFHEQFGYYYAAIYLVDHTGRWAELKEATGEAGRVLKQNHHRLEITGRSMVGAAIRERAPRIAQIASLEKQRSENPLLPYTRSEVALPLMVGERVLGALNVQSTKESDFGPQVIETMKNMASQVTIALENARLFQEAQQMIMEMRAVQRQYLLEGWSDFSQANKQLEYRLGDETDENARKLEVPIVLRDQALGDILLERKEEWTPEQRSLVDAVATQAAVALENARLVSESRQIALRERMVAEINSKIWTSATIDGVLQTAIKELGRRLDASIATVELRLDGAPEDEA